MVVSSVTPMMPSAMRCQRRSSSASTSREQAEDDRELLVVGGRRVGHRAGALELDALVHEQRGVATVVEDHVRAACCRRRPGHDSARSVHHQYSSSVSPFQANTGMPAAAIAAAAWSWVEKMLQRRPAHLGAERDERLDEHRGLDRHVQRAGDARAGERLGRRA